MECKIEVKSGIRGPIRTIQGRDFKWVGKIGGRRLLRLDPSRLRLFQLIHLGTPPHHHSTPYLFLSHVPHLCLEINGDLLGLDPPPVSGGQPLRLQFNNMSHAWNYIVKTTTLITESAENIRPAINVWNHYEVCIGKHYKTLREDVDHMGIYRKSYIGEASLPF